MYVVREDLPLESSLNSNSRLLYSVEFCYVRKILQLVQRRNMRGYLLWVDEGCV